MIQESGNIQSSTAPPIYFTSSTFFFLLCQYHGGSGVVTNSRVKCEEMMMNKTFPNFAKDIRFVELSEV